MQLLQKNKHNWMPGKALNKYQERAGMARAVPARSSLEEGTYDQTKYAFRVQAHPETVATLSHDGAWISIFAYQ